MKFYTYFFFLFSPVLGAPSPPTNLICDGSLPKDASPSVAVNFLKQDRVALNLGCVLDAIHLLDTAKFLPAIPTLIDYLDFKFPDSMPRRHSPGPTAGVYPAADALVHFSDRLPRTVLKDLIADNNELNGVKRINAAEVLLSLNSQDVSNIQFLVTVSQSSPDQQLGGQFLALAKEAAERCSAANRDACRKAAQP